MLPRFTERRGRVLTASGLFLCLVWIFWELIKDAVFGAITNALAERWDLIFPTIQQHFPSAWDWTPPAFVLIAAAVSARIIYSLGRKSVSVSDARKELATLRTEGVKIRNKGRKLPSVNSINPWIDEVKNWSEKVQEAIKKVNEADAEWFDTLDVVPPPRLDIVTGPWDFAHGKFYQNHDYKLKRLDGLIQKYKD